jgi:two-component system chemotaxis sensor kinase CheA
MIDALLSQVRFALADLDISDADTAELAAIIGPGLSVPDPPIAAPEPVPQQAAAAPAPVSAPPPPAMPVEAPAKAAGEGEAPGVQTIRVSVDALEQIMTVVSELVLIRNQLLQLLRLDPESAFSAPLYRLNQVTSELQEGVMTTRMQPINGAWSKLPRLVRDLAHDLGKKIQLTTEGQDTELDRQVLELIKDPLTHMVRNSASPCRPGMKAAPSSSRCPTTAGACPPLKSAPRPCPAASSLPSRRS